MEAGAALRHIEPYLQSDSAGAGATSPTRLSAFRIVATDPLQDLQAVDLHGRAALKTVALAIATAFRPREVLPAQFALALTRMEILHHPVSVGQFTRLCLLETNGHYAVDRLINMGLIQSTSSSEPRRTCQVSTTGTQWLGQLRMALSP